MSRLKCRLWFNDAQLTTFSDETKRAVRLSVSLDARSRADGGVAEGQLQALLVDERYRRRGTGMVLMSIAKQELRLRGMHIGSVLLALIWSLVQPATTSVSYTHLQAHETRHDL